ncbi:MAG: hypothetical protein KAX30_09840, partial [Candidatus Atribacteria bacterium]|nr:hypothetical protein [Candidatus Atribacteria bacterium]
KYLFIGSGQKTPEIFILTYLDTLKNSIDEMNVKNIIDSIDTDFCSTELSSTFLVSKKISFLKVYGGLNFYYADIDWKDNVVGKEYDGYDSGINIILGSKIFNFSSLSLTIECSFVETESFLASIGITF